MRAVLLTPILLATCALTRPGNADAATDAGATPPAPVPASPADGSTDPASLLHRLDAISGRLDAVAKTQEPELKPLSLALPSLTFDVPSAYGASSGDFGIGLGYQKRQRYGNRADGVEGLAFGFGDAGRLGLEIEAVNKDTSNPLRSTSVGFKLHRLLPNDSAIAVGVENITVNGDSDSNRSAYVALTRKFKLRPSSRAPFSRLFLTTGIGNGRFRSERDVAFRKKVVNSFDCVAVNLGPPAMAFVEWTGQDFNAGISLVPFRNQQLVIPPAISDISRSAGDGPRFTLAISYIPGH